MVEKNIGSLALTVNQMVDQLSHAYISLIKSNVAVIHCSTVAFVRFFVSFGNELIP